MATVYVNMVDMDFPPEPKAALLRYLHVAHDAVLWKLEGVGEYDLRRPLTPTGTNLLGLVKHLALVEFGYFSEVFDRPHGIELPDVDHDNNGDMFVEAHESRDDILALFAQARVQATATIEALDLDAQGHVPWWGDNNPVTLQLIAIHMATEIHRHLGQMDILREGLDGAVGMRKASDNMPSTDEAYWKNYCAMLEAIAAGFA